MNENVKFVYEKAIDAYELSVEKVKSKIFGYSALIVLLFALYLSPAGRAFKCFNGMSPVIALAGVLISICAIYSFWGAIAWQKSWEQILAHHENLFIKDSGLTDNNRLYTVVAGNGKFYSNVKIIELIFGCTTAMWIILLFKEVFWISMKIFFCGFWSCGGKFSLIKYGCYYSSWPMVFLGMVAVCLLALVYLFLRAKNINFNTNTDYMFKLENDTIINPNTKK